VIVDHFALPTPPSLLIPTKNYVTSQYALHSNTWWYTNTFLLGRFLCYQLLSFGLNSASHLPPLLDVVLNISGHSAMGHLWSKLEDAVAIILQPPIHMFICPDPWMHLTFLERLAVFENWLYLNDTILDISYCLVQNLKMEIPYLIHLSTTHNAAVAQDHINCGPISSWDSLPYLVAIGSCCPSATCETWIVTHLLLMSHDFYGCTKFCSSWQFWQGMCHWTQSHCQCYHQTLYPGFSKFVTCWMTLFGAPLLRHTLMFILSLTVALASACHTFSTNQLLTVSDRDTSCSE